LLARNPIGNGDLVCRTRDGQIHLVVGPGQVMAAGPDRCLLSHNHKAILPKARLLQVVLNFHPKLISAILHPLTDRVRFLGGEYPEIRPVPKHNPVRG
jgi:hypothetical protein